MGQGGRERESSASEQSNYLLPAPQDAALRVAPAAAETARAREEGNGQSRARAVLLHGMAGGREEGKCAQTHKKKPRVQRKVVQAL